MHLSGKHWVMAILRLIRVPNLLIVVLTQYLIRHAVLEPILEVNGFELQLSHGLFFVLVLATCFVTGAGYVINDYFDTRSDLINRPGRVIVGKSISRRKAIALHIGLTSLGLLTGFYVSYRIGLPQLVMIFALVSGLLWFYSTTYKNQLILGNLLVAALTAMVPLLVAVYEIPLLNREYGHYMIVYNLSFKYIFGWVGGFAFFAFITTLIREIIKDAEDFEGDVVHGRNTVPIVFGIQFTKGVIAVLVVLTIVTLVLVYLKWLLLKDQGQVDFLSMGYFLFLLIMPLAYLCLMLYRATNKDDYHQMSAWMKWIMLAGVLYALVVRVIVSGF
jgi:4-hydroxybenzoate polyprenyltransferase